MTKEAFDKIATGLREAIDMVDAMPTDTDIPPSAWADNLQWANFSFASWPTHIPVFNYRGDDRIGLFTRDKLDAAVSAAVAEERERIAKKADLKAEHYENGARMAVTLSARGIYASCAKAMRLFASAIREG